MLSAVNLPTVIYCINYLFYTVCFQLVDKEMFWVVTEIVNESNLVKRMKIMKHFIKIASKLLFFSWTVYIGTVFKMEQFCFSVQ